METKVEMNKVVSVHYTGAYTDGEIFDTSEGRDPLSFLVGHGQMISGFEQEMLEAGVTVLAMLASPLIALLDTP